MTTLGTIGGGGGGRAAASNPATTPATTQISGTFLMAARANPIARPKAAEIWSNGDTSWYSVACRINVCTLHVFLPVFLDLLRRATWQRRQPERAASERVSPA